jgi:hypothetical protein
MGVLFNLNTSKPKDDRWLKRHQNVHFHFTPTKASWLNQVEIWFSILAAKALSGASFTSIAELKSHLEAFIETYRGSSARYEADLLARTAMLAASGIHVGTDFKTQLPPKLFTHDCCPNTVTRTCRRFATTFRFDEMRNFILERHHPSTFSGTDVLELAQRLNATPRKCLGFQTPAEVFSTHLLHFKCESTYRSSRG